MAEGTEPKPIREPVIRSYPTTGTTGTPLLTLISNLPDWSVSFYHAGPTITIDGMPSGLTGEKVFIFMKININVTDILLLSGGPKMTRGRQYVSTLSWSETLPA